MKKIFRIFALMAVAAMMLTACSKTENKAEAKDLTSTELAAIINECGGEWAESFPAVEINDEAVTEFYTGLHGWDYANIREGATSFSQFITHAYSITIVKPTEGNADNVTKHFEAYRDTMIANFDRYLIDQYDIAKATIIEDVNGYVVMVMAEDAQSIFDAISAKLK